LKTKLAAIIGLILVFQTAKPQCFEQNIAFKSGEVMKYDVVYHWGFIWLEAGLVEFKVMDKIYNNRPVYHFFGFGKTLKKHEWIYKVRDTYEAYLDKETLRPLWHRQDTEEGGYKSDYKYIFDQENKLVHTFTDNSKEDYKEETLRLPDCTFDLMSMIYYSRNLDFSKIAINDTVPLHAVIKDEIHDLYIRYLGKEEIELKDGRTFKCQKFSVLLVEGTIFEGGEDMFVWVTDDRNKIPVLIEAKILVGSVKAVLSGTEGLIRYPETIIK
jgi:hypothetical protein